MQTRVQRQGICATLLLMWGFSDKGGVIQNGKLPPVCSYEDKFVVGIGISYNEDDEQSPGTWFFNFDFLILKNYQRRTT